MKISDLGVLTLCSIHYASDARVSQVIGRLHTDSGFIIVYELIGAWDCALAAENSEVRWSGVIGLISRRRLTIAREAGKKA